MANATISESDLKMAMAAIQKYGGGDAKKAAFNIARMKGIDLQRFMAEKL